MSVDEDRVLALCDHLCRRAPDLRPVPGDVSGGRAARRHSEPDHVPLCNTGHWLTSYLSETL